MTRRRFVPFLIPIAIAVGIFYVLTQTRPEPDVVPLEERTAALRVVTVEPVDVVPRALAYGTAEPGRVWRAVARVGGRVVQVDDELQSGARIRAARQLVQIDPTPYELAIARLEADVARFEADLVQIDVELENDKAALEIEKQSSQLADSELERYIELGRSGSVSSSEVDAVRRNALTQRQSVQSLESLIALHPSGKKSLEAQLRAAKVSLSEARLDLEYTRIATPFPGILADVQLEVGQFVSAGETLFEMYGEDRVDVDASLLYAQAQKLISPEMAVALAHYKTEGRNPEELLDERFMTIVRMQSGDYLFEWESRPVGMREVIDENTRAFAVRVSVDDPFEKAIPGVRPPLLKGSFCEVEIRGPAHKGRIVVPRAAVREGVVRVLDAGGRMRGREVETLFVQGNLAVLGSGVEPGERVVVSDLGQALDGMRVDATEDEALAAMLLAEARGDGRLE